VRARAPPSPQRESSWLSLVPLLAQWSRVSARSTEPTRSPRRDDVS
jgi:hypothetical protein